MTKHPTITFKYTNWRGITEIRRAIPIRVFYGETQYHQDEQWLMEAYCEDRRENRVFAMTDMEPASSDTNTGFSVGEQPGYAGLTVSVRFDI